MWPYGFFALQIWMPIVVLLWNYNTQSCACTRTRTRTHARTHTDPYILAKLYSHIGIMIKKSVTALWSSYLSLPSGCAVRRWGGHLAGRGRSSRRAPHPASIGAPPPASAGKAPPSHPISYPGILHQQPGPLTLDPLASCGDHGGR